MKQVFAQLTELQKTDSDLAMLRARLEELPKRIARLKEEAGNMHSQLETVRQAITEHKKEYKLAEVELKATEEKISSYSVQLYSAKTNEQYKAFLKEIDTQKKIKSRIEDRMIILMEEAEELENKRQTLEKEVAATEAETAQKVAMLEKEKEELVAAISEREQLRAALVASLPPNVLALYERIRKNKAGLAVVTTRNDRCNGCYNPVPAQRLLEIERQDRIFTCEACGRILVPDKK